MKANLVVQTLLDHKSIRRFSDKPVSDEVIATIVQAGQQAPFASQYYSVLLSRHARRNPMNAPLLFTICVDSFKFERIMAKRNWKLRALNDTKFLLIPKTIKHVVIISITGNSEIILELAPARMRKLRMLISKILPVTGK